MPSGGSLGQAARGWAWRWRFVILAVGLAMALTGAGRATPVAASPPPDLDASGAYAFLAFCRAAREGHPWSEAAIRSLAVSAPYRAMIAHHASLDSTVTPEAFVAMLLALRNGRPYPGPTGRLMRIHATYKAALSELPQLEARLAAICSADVVAGALARAQAHLPPGTPLPTQVWLLADGFTRAYSEGKVVVVDLLQTSRASSLESQLAHELHLAGTAALLPPTCPDPQLGLALDTLASMVQEGAATAWINGWRAAPSRSDGEQVAGFMRAVLASKLAPEETESWFSGLIDDGRDGGGPLYRLGNALVVELTERYGQAWVRARLSDPVALLRAWQGTAGDGPFEEVLALLENGRDRCPEWLTSKR